jgi:LysR family transcriptional regulator, benzoate and cis,cis-muconate-responsive activator of ben and cat genes
MEDLEVRELRYFVAVAEELNFSRAAQRLGMAQPPLSRAIRRMERRLGADLFERDTHRVALTTAGAALLGDARGALEVMSALTRRAHRAANATPTLVVTAKPGTPAGMLRAIVDAYRKIPGAMPVQIVVSGYGQQADLVRDGRADVALLGSPYDERGLDAEPLTSEPRVVALPVDHPLARRDRLRCRDLRGEPVPQWPQWTPVDRLYWSGQDRPLAQPDTSPEGHDRPDGPVVADPGQLLEVVSLGQAVALIPESVAQHNDRADIAYRPVVDASPYITAIGWPRETRSRPIAQFVRTAIELNGPREEKHHAARTAA